MSSFLLLCSLFLSREERVSRGSCFPFFVSICFLLVAWNSSFCCLSSSAFIRAFIISFERLNARFCVCVIRNTGKSSFVSLKIFVVVLETRFYEVGNFCCCSIYKIYIRFDVNFSICIGHISENNLGIVQKYV